METDDQDVPDFGGGAGHGSAGVLAGKVAIVTGAAQGIGEGIARLFAEEGASIVLADLNEAQGETVARQLQARGAFGQVVFQRCDVADAVPVRGLIDFTARELGRLDILVNNAGHAVFRGIEVTSEAE